MKWIVLTVAFLVGCGGAPFTESDRPLGGEGAPDVVTVDTSNPDAGGETDDGPQVIDRDAAQQLEGAAGDLDAVAMGGSSSGSSSGGSSSGGSGSGSSSGGSSSGGSGCTTSSVRCAGLQPQTCASGVWIDSGGACSAVCLNGACVACSPGQTQCSSSTQPQTCSPAGTWQNSAACSNQACVNGSCTGSCAPGATQCSTTTQPQTCNASGVWVNAAACTNQTCVSGTCTGVCAPGQSGCASSTVYASCGVGGQLVASTQSCSVFGGCCIIEASGAASCGTCP